MSASPTEVEEAPQLVELVDRYLEAFDAMERELDAVTRWKKFVALKPLSTEILRQSEGLVITRHGRALVPLLENVPRLHCLKVLRYRDLDLEQFYDHESHILGACRRAMRWPVEASEADLADLAGEFRRMLDCPEREALGAALDLSRLGPDVEPPEDLTDLARLARHLVDDANRSRRPFVVDGPPFDQAEETDDQAEVLAFSDDPVPTIFRFTDEEIRSMMPGPGRE